MRQSLSYCGAPVPKRFTAKARQNLVILDHFAEISIHQSRDPLNYFAQQVANTGHSGIFKQDRLKIADPVANFVHFRFVKFT